MKRLNQSLLFGTPALRAVVLLALNFAAALVVFGPVRQGYLDLRHDLNEREAVLVDYQTRKQKVNDSGAILTQIAKDRTVLDKVFVSPDTVVDFILTLEQTAQQTGVTQSLSYLPATPVTKDPIQPAVSFRVGAEGEFPAVIQYLAAVENLPLALNVREISLSSQGPVAPTTPDVPAAAHVRLGLVLRVGTTEPVNQLEVSNL